MIFQYIRRFSYEIHLWPSIVSGIILFIVCLSGTILTFQDEYRHIAEPTRYFVRPPASQSFLSADELIAKVEAEKPGMNVDFISIPEQANRTVMMTLVAPTPNSERPPRAEGTQRLQGETTATGRADTRQARPGGGNPRYNPNRVFVNPYTGEIVGEGANVIDPLLTSMIQLHRFLWLPIEIGRPVVGIATIIFCLVCLLGLVLWVPRSWRLLKSWNAWKSGLRMRFRNGMFPFIYDLHKTVGFYILIPSLILGLTGLCWSFAWYRDAASYLLGDEIFKQRRFQAEKIEAVDASQPLLSVNEMIALQNRLTPGPGAMTITIPQDNETALVIRKGRTGFFSLAMPDRTQWDRYRGTVVPVEHFGKMVEVERFVDMPLGAQIAASIRGLHLGDITGMSSKIFFGIVCLFATSLPVTGVMIWIKKLRVKYKKRKVAKDNIVD
ncbi:MAG: PepSY domain-containing protein [Planctomycetaceae bacterium]|nr:PepSY domain-containing protein [Planctomycetaceae bacterium]